MSLPTSMHKPLMMPQIYAHPLRSRGNAKSGTAKSLSTQPLLACPNPDHLALRSISHAAGIWLHAHASTNWCCICCVHACLCRQRLHNLTKVLGYYHVRWFHLAHTCGIMLAGPKRRCHCRLSGAKSHPIPQEQVRSNNCSE